MKFNLFILLLFLAVCFTVHPQENPYQNYADKLFLDKDYDRAFRSYGNAIKADKPEDNNYDLFLNAGDCAFLLNFKQIALSYYGLAAQRQAPSDDLIKHIRGIYCGNDPLCVASTLKEVVAKHPETLQKLYPEIATILYNQSEYKDAIPILKECLLFSPDNFSVLKMLATSHFHVGETDSAYVVYKKIIEHYNDYDAFVFIGNYYFITANKCAKSDSTLTKNKSFFSRYRGGNTSPRPEYYNYYNKATEYLEKAYTLYNSEEIRKSLIEIYTIIGNKEKITTLKK